MSNPSGATRVVQFTGVSDDETIGTWVDCSQSPYVVVFIKGTGTTSSGVITIEEVDYDPHTQVITGQTPSSITTVNASDVSGGLQKAIHLTVGAYAFVRCRISTAIGGGGTVEAVIRANS